MLAYDILDGDNPSERESGITQTKIEEESDIEWEEESAQIEKMKMCNF